MKDGRRLGDTLEFVRLVVAKAQSGAAVDDRSGDAPRSSASAEAAKERIEAIKQNAIEKGYDPTHRLWPHAQLEPLYRRAYGSAPLETSGTDGNVGRRRR